MSNVSVSITANVVDLQAKFAVARSESSALTAELNKLARQAATSGMTDTLKAQLNQAAEAALNAKAKTAALGAELKAQTSSVSSMTGALGLAQQAMGAFGLTLGIGAVIGFGRSILETAANIQKQADVLGISTTALQAYQFAARQSGVSTEAADTALERFYANVGKAEDGTGPAAVAFRTLGLDVDNLSSDMDTAAPKVAAALLRINDGFERAALAKEIFGRGGQEMNAMLDQLAKGLDENARAASNAGEMMDEKLVAAAKHADVEIDSATMKLKVWVAEGVEAVVGAKTLGGAIETLGEEFSNLFASAVGLDMPKIPAPPPKPAAAPKPTAKDIEQADLNRLDAYDSKQKEREQTLAQIAKAQKALNEAKAVGDDPKGVAKATAVLDDLNKKLDELNKKPSPLKGTGFSSYGEEEIAKAHETIAAINANEQIGGAERIKEIQAVYTQLLASSKLNEGQRVAIGKESYTQLAAAHKAAAAEERAIDQNNAQTSVKIAEIGFNTQKSILGEQVAEGKITKDQQLEAEIALVTARADLETKALTTAEAGHDADTAYFKAKENEKTVIAAQAEADRAALRRQIIQQSANEELAIQKEAFAQVTSASNSMISGMLTGHQSFYQSLGLAAGNFIEKEIEDDARYLIAHILFSQEALAADKSLGASGLLLHSAIEATKTTTTAGGTAARTAITETGAVTENATALERAAHWIASEFGMTAATAAGTSVRTGITVAGTATGTAIEKAAAASTISVDAAKAAAGTYSALAGIPYIGPFIAPVGAAIAYGAVEAFGVFDVGTNMVPRDMPAIVHAGERIIPKADNTALMRALSSGTQAGGSNIHLHYEPTVNAMDRKPFDETLEENSDTMISWFHARKRDGSLDLSN